jgi:DNA-binding transcriptional LysR family regulator
MKPSVKPSVRQLECFAAVVEAGAFSRASARLGLSQPALSLAIKELEEGLGARLFDRTTRRVELTEAGRVFQATALAGLAEIDRAVGLVRDLAALKHGLVRIAAPPLLAATVLPKIMRQAAIDHPGLQVRMEDLGTDAIAAHLRAGRAELGLGTFPPEVEGLAITPILRDTLAVFIRPGHRLGTRSNLGWNDLVGQPLVVLTRESGLRRLVERGFEEAGLPFRPAHEVHQIYTALGLVHTLGAVAVLPLHAREAIHGRRFQVLPLVRPVIGREIALARREDREPSAATQAVAQLIRRNLRTLMPDLPPPT